MIASLVRKIAVRFVFDRKGTDDPLAHGFVSFIAAISVAGLALGVTALLVVTSVMNGFERELKNALTSFHGHVILFSRGESISHYEKYITDIKTVHPNVVGVSPYIFSEIMLSSPHGVAGSVVEGVHQATLSDVSLIATKLVGGALPHSHSGMPEITLGVEVARKLHAKVGDEIALTIPFLEKDNQPLVKKVRVQGIVKLGMYDYDSKYSLMDLEALQEVLGMIGRVNAFKILTKDLDASLKVTAALNERYSYPLRARDWSSLNRNLFYAIRLEKIVIGIILTAIVLVASFNIVSTLIMMVHDKRRQISMLRALGFKPRSTFAVFILIGASMALCGSVLGLGLGRALCALVQWKSLIELPADIYLFSRLPIEMRPWEWILISGGTVFLAVVSTFIPSYRVSREVPAEGLKYE